MLLQLAFRNITAYRRRTLVTLLLTTLTTGLLVFSSGWMDGSHQTLIRNSVEIYPGYIEVTATQYRRQPSFDHLIFDTGSLAAKLARQPEIAVFAARFENYVLFSAGEKAVGGMLAGIEPEKESRISRLASSLKKGAWLTGEDTNQVYMGDELARRLRVDVGDELAFIGTGADYSFAADLLKVKGIFRTGLYDFDAGSAFLAKPYFDRIMAADNLATHVIIQPKRPEQAEQVAVRIGKVLGSGYETASWKQTMAPLVKAMQLDSLFGYVTLGILFLVIFFVIMIYTLLTVFARVREIGVLRAIGTSPGQVFGLLLLESCLLTLAGVVAGGLLGGLATWYFEQHPMIFAGFEEQFKQYGLAVSAMPTAFQPMVILRDMTVMFVLSLLSTLYPIARINRYSPVEAIRHV